MNIIKAYYCLNLKMLAKDKLSFIWSLFLPIIMLFFNDYKFLTPLDIRSYWSYIIFSSYVFGIGLHALKQKESGTLKTYFSIKDSRVEFFLANVLTQMSFCFVCIFFFNGFVMIFTGLNFFIMSLYSTILIFLALPISFVFFNITLLNKVHSNSVSTLLSIITCICLVSMSADSVFNIVNPLKYISDILIIKNSKQIIAYIFISVFFILSGIYSIKSYSITSNEMR